MATDEERCPACGGKISHFGFSHSDGDWCERGKHAQECLSCSLPYKHWKEWMEMKEALNGLPRISDVELAIKANNMGVLDFREEYWDCDPSVGQSACQYCAIDAVLRRLLNILKTRPSENTKG